MQNRVPRERVRTEILKKIKRIQPRRVARRKLHALASGDDNRRPRPSPQKNLRQFFGQIRTGRENRTNVRPLQFVRTASGLKSDKPDIPSARPFRRRVHFLLRKSQRKQNGTPLIALPPFDGRQHGDILDPFPFGGFHIRRRQAKKGKSETREKTPHGDYRLYPIMSRRSFFLQATFSSVSTPFGRKPSTTPITPRPCPVSHTIACNGLAVAAKTRHTS